MNWYSTFCTHRKCFVPARVSNGPGKRALTAVATALGETAKTPKHVPKRNAGREHVSQFPHGHAANSGIENNGERRAGEPAVKNESASLHHEDLPPWFARKIFVPIGRDVQRTGADDCADDQPRPGI